jgi:hypothetical protein
MDENEIDTRPIEPRPGAMGRIYSWSPGASLGAGAAAPAAEAALCWSPTMSGEMEAPSGSAETGARGEIENADGDAAAAGVKKADIEGCTLAPVLDARVPVGAGRAARTGRAETGATLVAAVMVLGNVRGAKTPVVVVAGGRSEIPPLEARSARVPTMVGNVDGEGAALGWGRFAPRLRLAAGVTEAAAAAIDDGPWAGLPVVASSRNGKSQPGTNPGICTRSSTRAKLVKVTKF